MSLDESLNPGSFGYSSIDRTFLDQLRTCSENVHHPTTKSAPIKSFFRRLPPSRSFGIGSLQWNAKRASPKDDLILFSFPVSVVKRYTKSYLFEAF
jgi:hypothetical protein